MFIFSPSEAEKQPRVPKIVFLTRKMTNVMEYITFFDFAAYASSHPTTGFPLTGFPPSEVAEVTEVKQPRNPKRRKF